MSAEPRGVPMVCPACNSRYDGGAFCARDGTPLVKDLQAGKEDLVGQVLAERYRVLKLIGEGGMGQVYEAQHVNINKRFAIKLLRPEIVSNPEAVQRFRQEAWSASSIGHENIIEIEDFATLPSGAVYLAMEYLVGQSLADRLRQPPPLAFAGALDVMLQVSSGLAAAHEKGIIHRDMKPENIFVGQKHGRPTVKILDFGIAKVSGDEGKSLTRTGTIFGTPHYMSPEQALGKALDHRADIYSVGVIMYELFTGRVPFEAESFMGILTKHITTAPTAPHLIAPDRDIPEDIEAVILRSMAKEPDERYQSMAELGGDLATIAQERAPEVLVRPGSQPMPAASPSKVLRAASGARASATPSRPFVTQPPTASEVETELTPTTNRGARVALIAGAALVLIGGALAVTLSLKPKAVPATPLVVAAPPQPTLPKPVAKVDAPKPAVEPAMQEVIVDSLPPGAKIFVDGVAVADTPEAIKVAVGATKTIVLRKDGFVDQTELLDPAKERKKVVRLQRAHAAATRGKTATPPPAMKLPAPPPVPVEHPRVAEPAAPPPPPAPSPAPAPVAAPAPPKPRPKRVADPYERIDERAPKKGSGDVLNPY